MDETNNVTDSLGGLNNETFVHHFLDLDYETESSSLDCEPKNKEKIQDWKQNKRKLSRNSGTEFLSTRNEVVHPRLSVDCQCSRKCTDKLPQEAKEKLLEDFNNLEDKNDQDAYLFKQILKLPIARRRRKPPQHDDRSKFRRYTFQYIVNVDGADLSVCKPAFCGLHGITKGRVYRLSNHKINSDTPPLDMRGKSAGSRATKKTDAEIEKIKEHIGSCISSGLGYSRKRTSRKNLNSEFSVKKMHRLFLEKYDPGALEKLKNNEKVKPHVTYEYYNNIFCTYFACLIGNPIIDV